ncbi:hypothetical protein JUJ52_22740 [Virgibacillus sp. AGTR]|uniref:hypothetical protein n=1 Tax=Virgibacillus sp. AGTR TaxID=2812055 RepID=UPI001D1688B2|nr:hypothetical protein [Virgibacillus sp. AGTR]MCC2252743.1 hypothetical protein [Virgibacillus sp. AGTR]
MKHNQEKFYKVTMRVEVEREVLANSEAEAREKVDTSDMVYEIKKYRMAEELLIEEIKSGTPNVYAQREIRGNPKDQPATH